MRTKNLSEYHKNRRIELQLLDPVLSGTITKTETVEQNGGGFKIDKAGIISLYGKTVQLGGQGQVNLLGNVNYTIGGGMIPPATTITPPLVRQEIEKIKDERDSSIFNLAWDNSIVPLEKTVHAMFSVSNCNPGDTATVEISVWKDEIRTLVDTLTVTLDDGSGHYSLPWQQIIEEASNELNEDDDAPVYPLEYYFEVDVDGTKAVETSNPLWRTKTVIIEPEIEDGQLLPDGTAVILESADERKHYGYVKNGTVQFDNVVLGPLKINLNEYEHRS